MGFSLAEVLTEEERAYLDMLLSSEKEKEEKEQKTKKEEGK